ncbi:hypothetical protein Tco_0713815 [Tanacetum coccineum]
MNDPNITMEEYIRLEEEKARRRGKVYNWETATYGKIWDNVDVHDLRSIETEFPSIVFTDTLTSEAALRVGYGKVLLTMMKLTLEYRLTNPTMKIARLEEEKARRPWKGLITGKCYVNTGDLDNEDVHDLGSVETEFPAIVFNDTLTSEAALSCEPTVSSLNNDEINFRISFDESDDEDCTIIFDKNSFSCKIISVNNLKTDSENDNDKVNMPLLPSPKPTVSYFDDLDFFKDFENEFPAIVYNNAQTSKSDLLTEPILNPQHIDEFNLKDETSLSECDEEEQNDLVKEISTNIGEEFTNLEILKCWSLETSRRLFNTKSCS